MERAKTQGGTSVRVASGDEGGTRAGRGRDERSARGERVRAHEGATYIGIEIKGVRVPTECSGVHLPVGQPSIFSPSCSLTMALMNSSALMVLSASVSALPSALVMILSRAASTLSSWSSMSLTPLPDSPVFSLGAARRYHSPVNEGNDRECEQR